MAGVRGEGRSHPRWKLRELPGVSRRIQTPDANGSSRHHKKLLKHQMGEALETQVRHKIDEV